MYLKKSYQHSQVKQDLKQICNAMRDDDFEFQKKNGTPALGAAAFAQAVKIEAAEQVEVLWAQRKIVSSKPSDSKPVASYTTCYYYGDKGHYAFRPVLGASSTKRQVTWRKCVERRMCDEKRCLLEPLLPIFYFQCTCCFGCRLHTWCTPGTNFWFASICFLRS